MELLFTFDGIKLIDGQMPRGLVDARMALNDTPDALPTFNVLISLPLNRYDETLEATAARCLAAAKSLLNESVAVQWMEQQPTEALPPMCSPADAAQRLGKWFPVEALSDQDGGP